MKKALRQYLFVYAISVIGGISGAALIWLLAFRHMDNMNPLSSNTEKPPVAATAPLAPTPLAPLRIPGIPERGSKNSCYSEAEINGKKLEFAFSSKDPQDCLEATRAQVKGNCANIRGELPKTIQLRYQFENQNGTDNVSCRE